MYHQTDFATRAEARTAIVEYIEVYYNRKRLHSTLDYLTPLEAHRAAKLNQADETLAAKLNTELMSKEFDTAHRRVKQYCRTAESAHTRLIHLLQELVRLRSGGRIRRTVARDGDGGDGIGSAGGIR